MSVAPSAQSDSPATVIKAPSTPTRSRAAQLHPTTPERVSSLAQHAISVSSPSLHTPPRKLHFPRDLILGSPCDYHNPDKLDSWLSADGKPNKKLRDYAHKLPGKAVDSTAIGSAKKDMEKIRLKRKCPDVNGEIEVTPTHPGPRKRIYKVHEVATSKENVHRLYPCSGPNIVTLTGKEKAALIDEHAKAKQKGDHRSFEQRLRERVIFKERSLESAAPQAEQPKGDEFKPTHLLFQ